ncbi:MAG: zinc ribbon domain-containing protein [bacterium]
MPLKEFKCTGCKEVFEALVFNKSDEDRLTCPKCGSKQLTILFSAFSVSGTEKKVSSISSCTSCSTKSCNTCK